MTSRTITVILAVVLFIPAAARAAIGESLFKQNCSGCHGELGEGRSGPILNKDGLLRTVDESYFAKTMRYGRAIRGCPPFEKKLSEDKIKKIAAYIKGWQKGKTLEAPGHGVEPKLTERGRINFSLCGGCHGLEGEGAMGPPLLDKGFLMSISDTELRRTIMHGRPGTPMKGYTKGMGGMTVLTAEEIDELISYMRYRQRELK